MWIMVRGKVRCGAEESELTLLMSASAESRPSVFQALGSHTQPYYMFPFNQASCVIGK